VRYVRTTVRDTGCGMDHAVMERMFEPFYTTKDIGRGTGLGLSAVHGIVADHKGAMLVTSKPGEGTSFELFFPLHGVAEDAGAGKSTGLPSGSERILVVDDEPQIARTTAKLLERLGYRPTAFSSPQEALAAFEAAPEEWGLVVTDQTMPQLTGIELAHKMLSRRPDLPIILCSGFGLGLNDASIRALGLRAFLPKPVEQGELARAVRSGIDRRPG
jgi:two-component system, cell cycle sensor histidine kinase and response regulator CckA